MLFCTTLIDTVNNRRQGLFKIGSNPVQVWVWSKGQMCSFDISDAVLADTENFIQKYGKKV